MTTLNDRLESSLLEHPEVKHQMERARAQLVDLDARARRVIQERPVLAVGAALAFGYVLARLLRGR